jgi:hypothetical protein
VYSNNNAYRETVTLSATESLLYIFIHYCINLRIGVFYGTDMSGEYMQKNRILSKFDMKNGKFRDVRNSGIVLKGDNIFIHFLCHDYPIFTPFFFGSSAYFLGYSCVGITAMLPQQVNPLNSVVNHQQDNPPF